MKSEFFKNEATLFKFGITKNVEHGGEKVQVSGPSFAEETSGIYLCICQKYFKTKAGLTMHQSWCKKVVSVENKLNIKPVVFSNTTNQIEKEVASVVDEMLDKVTKEQPTVTSNVERVENRKGAVNRKSYDNSFKMTVINACNRKRISD